MKILKEGRVVFESGRIVRVEGFEVENGTLEDLAAYVARTYQYFGVPLADIAMVDNDVRKETT